MKIKPHIGVLAVVPLTIWGATKLATTPTTARAQGETPPVLLLNGDFSQTQENSRMPPHWDDQLDPDTRARVSLASEGARSAPTALSIDVEIGTARVKQNLQGLPTKPTVLSGYAKAPAADQTVQGVLQVFGAEGNAPIQTIAIPIERSSEWKEFSRRLLLPKSATRATLIFEVHGKGEVLLDDITLGPTVPGNTGSPDNPTSPNDRPSPNG